jgi:hypothetical protein
VDQILKMDSRGRVPEEESHNMIVSRQPMAQKNHLDPHFHMMSEAHIYNSYYRLGSGGLPHRHADKYRRACNELAYDKSDNDLDDLPK